MAPLMMLVTGFGFFYLLSWWKPFSKTNRADWATWSLVVMLFFVGGSHFAKTMELASIVPPWIPAPTAVVLWTGVLEMLFAVALLIPFTRRQAGLLIAVYFILVFPANIYGTLQGIQLSGTPSIPGYPWIRLFFQPLFIGWALWVWKLNSGTIK
ncbi:DoxX family protein [Melghirimyces algeriensis]|uniref:Uncharacterized membrane protein n=1 Tax=Melghirimyces algeriensis TaxID=910412 RepID=A0A521CBZ6_9BACL|nr:DoxX family protein [Melghirimyces algeriensis]SMO56962.1 Uncharacterized membrane protein [Melghirimyces algeriensis]